MSKPKHTPGPWSWEYYRDDHRPIALSSGTSDVLVATGDSERCWAAVSEADARLIEAAPTLLAELMDAESEARNELSRLRLTGEVDGPAYGNWAAKQQRWSVAIAKATGEPS